MALSSRELGRHLKSPSFRNVLEMIVRERVIEIAQAKMEGSDIYVVECKISPSNEVELIIDSDSHVSIDACITLSRAIEGEFDREVEDFSLTVCSAGIGSEIKLPRQFNRLMGRSVEVLLSDGMKYIGELVEAREEGITIKYEQKQLVEKGSGKMKREMVSIEQSFAFEQIKFVKEYLDFK